MRELTKNMAYRTQSQSERVHWGITEAAMRKIEKEVIGAFVKGETKMLGNTMSTLDPHTHNLNLMLHGNRIATMSNRDGVKKLWVSNAGWSSRTTQSRLNALFSLLDMPDRVYIKGGVQYLDSSRHSTINLSALRKSAVLVSVQ
jgi:hypothetical protein